MPFISTRRSAFCIWMDIEQTELPVPIYPGADGSAILYEDEGDSHR